MQEQIQETTGIVKMLSQRGFCFAWCEASKVYVFCHVKDFEDRSEFDRLRLGSIVRWRAVIHDKPDGNPRGIGIRTVEQ